MTQDIELQDLPTVATNDIPPDSLIPIAFRESNLTPFELYKITLEQLRIKLTTLNVEEIYNAFEKDPNLTNILFQLQNDLIIINYDETTLYNLVNDVQTFVIPQLNEVIVALTNQTTGSLYNMFQELTTIYNILDYLNQQALNALKTIIFSIPSRINDTLPYSVEYNYSNTNNQYSLYLEGFYNIVYVNIFIDTQVNLDRLVSIKIFNVQQVFETLALNLEGNITEFKISYRLKNGLKSNLQNIVEKRTIAFYKSNFANQTEVLYTLNSLETSLAEGDNFSFSLWFNKDGYIANDYNASKELLAEADIPRINQELEKKLKYVLNDNSIEFSEDGCFFSAKITNPMSNNIDIAVENVTDLKNRLFVLDLDCTNISEENVIVLVSLESNQNTVAIPNPKKRALFFVASELNNNIQTLTGLSLLDGISSSSASTIYITNEQNIVAENVEELTIFQNKTSVDDEQTIILNIDAPDLLKLSIVLDVTAIKNYYKTYKFTINNSIIKVFPLIWLGNENIARLQIYKIRIQYDIQSQNSSVEILESSELTKQIVDFFTEEMKILSNQLFSVNPFYPLGIISNRSSLNNLTNPPSFIFYTISNIGLSVPDRQNEYPFRGGCVIKTFDQPTSSKVAVFQILHITDWNVQNGVRIEKNPDEKALYIFIENLNKKYFCKFQTQLSRSFNSSIDIVFLLGTPTAILNDPNPSFSQTYGFQIAGNVEVFRKTIPNTSPSFSEISFVLDVVSGVATEEPYNEPIVDQFNSAEYWTIPEIQAYVAQQIAIIISGGTIDLSGYATIQNLNDAIALTVPLNQYNIDQNIVNSKLNDLENRVDVVEGDILTINGEIVTINNDIIDINQSIDDINLEINVIDASIIDLQNQIDLKASILYVNNINAQNQVQIVPYQII
jgi:mRNA-degrading endonuclease RelE of RelBE toxin-antitoxin system